MKTRNKPPAVSLVEWLPKVGLHGGIALDLGCGSGAEAEFLAEHGFMVDAIDKSEVIAKSAKDRCAGLTVDVVQGDFLQFELRPLYYTLAVAINALPFVTKDNCRELFARVKGSVKPGGAVIFDLYGPEHAWSAERPDMNFWTLEEVREAWGDWEILRLDEEKGMMPLASGTLIMQHRIHLVARKTA